MNFCDWWCIQFLIPEIDQSDTANWILKYSISESIAQNYFVHQFQVENDDPLAVTITSHFSFTNTYGLWASNFWSHVNNFFHVFNDHIVPLFLIKSFYFTVIYKIFLSYKINQQLAIIWGVLFNNCRVKNYSPSITFWKYNWLQKCKRFVPY